MLKLTICILAALTFASITATSAVAATPVNCGDILNQPGGHYVLTGSLVCATSPAVRIVADNVQLDLQGFTLSKSGSPTGAGIVTAQGNTCVVTSGVHIHNGSIKGFGTAISLCVPQPPGPVATHAEITGMTLTGNASGIAVFNAKENLIQGNTITLNFQDVGAIRGGILLSNSDENLIIQNTLNSNGGNGVELSASSGNVIAHNVVQTNTKSGIHIDAGSANNIVFRNHAHGNGAFDLADDNLNCGSNFWVANVFGSKSAVCIH